MTTVRECVGRQAIVNFLTSPHPSPPLPLGLSPPPGPLPHPGMYDIFLNFVDPDFRTPEKRADYLSFKVPLI